MARTRTSGTETADRRTSIRGQFGIGSVLEQQLYQFIVPPPGRQVDRRLTVFVDLLNVDPREEASPDIRDGVPFNVHHEFVPPNVPRRAQRWEYRVEPIRGQMIGFGKLLLFGTLRLQFALICGQSMESFQ